jgi:hypothetical protein
MPRNRQNSPASPARADTHADNNLRLQRYDGTDSKVRAQSWMALFELDTANQSIADRRKTLMYYLSGSALEWYADEIVSTDVTDWFEIKTKFFNRFGVSTATPLIDAQRRYLRRDETVLQYYQDKLRLLQQTKLSEQDIVHQLTEGLPHDWKLTLTAYVEKLSFKSIIDMKQVPPDHGSRRLLRNYKNRLLKVFRKGLRILYYLTV